MGIPINQPGLYKWNDGFISLKWHGWFRPNPRHQPLRSHRTQQPRGSPKEALAR